MIAFLCCAVDEDPGCNGNRVSTPEHVIVFGAAASHVQAKMSS